MISSEIKEWLVTLSKEKKVFLEGNILKLIETDEEDSEEFSQYIADCKSRDRSARKRRLDVTKEVQKQNKELIASSRENDKLMEQVKLALEEAKQSKQEAERAKDKALDDLDLIQKKTQFELINKIVQVALWVILGVGVLSTALFMVVLFTDAESSVVESTWSNLLGILLTNAFSIVGTIMGVKYASDQKNS